MEALFSYDSGLSQREQGPSPFGLTDQLQGWSWDRPQDPLLPLACMRDPGALLSTDLDRSSPLRLSVVSLEDDQLRALASELRSQGETVLELDPSRGEGVNELARSLQQQGRHYDEIQIFGHGANDSFRIGRNNVSNRTLWRHRGAFEAIGDALNPGGDLLLYGCNLAEGAKGKQLIEKLASITGADVAASTDLTYADGLSSDWDLEWSAGAVDDRAIHDVLTGLNWQGQLGGAAAITGSELSITGASGSIGISRAASGNIALTGTTQTSLTVPAATVISKVTVSGTSFEISGINLDSNSTDTLYPAAYDVVLNTTGSASNSGDLTVSGAIRSFGGNVSLSSPGKITIRSTDTSAIATLVDARTWSGSTATTTAGNLTINFKSEGQDIPLPLWLPQVNVNLEVGNTTGTGKTQIFTKDVKIAGASEIGSSLIPGESEGIAVANELLDTALYGIVNSLSPVPATIKSGNTSTIASFNRTEVRATGLIDLNLKSNLALKAPSTGSAWWQNSQLLWSAGVAVGSSKTDLSIRSSSLYTTGGDIKITTASKSEISVASTLKVNPDKIQVAGANPENSKDNNNKTAASLGLSVDNTTSKITLDADSELKAAGSVKIENTAEPKAETSSAAVLFYGGRGAASATIGYDKTIATIQIDGDIQSDGNTYVDAQGATSLFNAFWDYVQSGTGPIYTVTTTAGTAVTPTVSLAPGKVVRVANGDLYKFMGSTATSLNLLTLNITTDSRFKAIGSSTFAASADLIVGDKVKVLNASTGYAYKVRVLTDGTKILENSNGIEIRRSGSTSPFTIKAGDRILGFDGRHYLYSGTTELSTTLDKLKPSGADWSIAPLLESGDVMQITAILNNDVAGKDYILATSQPLDLIKDQATGTLHGIYKVRDTSLNAGLSTSIDLEKNEIILTPESGLSRDAFGPGQPVSYYVIKDKASGQDSLAIGGLAGDSTYYLIPRGGDRFALALTPEDALANRPIDLTKLGAGSQHILHYDLGKNTTVTADLQTLGHLE